MLSPYGGGIYSYISLIHFEYFHNESTMKSVEQTFSSSLTADPIDNNQSRQVAEAHYSFVTPEFTENPLLVHSSAEMRMELGMDAMSAVEFLEIVSGNGKLQGQQPYAMAYGGHQFGHWAGQLGDGRAINIGELHGKTTDWALQLKGAGRTPYSRTADGYAVLRSSIREYLCSEAMFHLGVPTTRALSIIETNREVLRDVLYNGNPAYEKGAVVCRVAPSFIRFGSFELFASRSDKKNLQKLVSYSAKKLGLDLTFDHKQDYLTFFEHILNSTVDLIVAWQRVGFVHGVMNTDNLSIHGVTIDYGPYGWLEEYDPNWTPNTTDAQNRRYRFGNQPGIAFWNLVRLANALYPLINETEGLQNVLSTFEPTFEKKYQQMMGEKLGLFEEDKHDESLVDDLTSILTKSKVDMTLFFRRLSGFNPEEIKDYLTVIEQDSYLDKAAFDSFSTEWERWLLAYSERLSSEPTTNKERMAKMNNVNPKYVLRNYMAQEAIEVANNGDYSLVDELFSILKSPYSEQEDKEKWFVKRPSWADHKVGCSMLSCSS